MQGYGLTETAPIVSLNHPFGTKKGSVGKAIAGVEVKIAPDGEILVRGENVTTGYFNAAEETARAFEDGWFHTGDIGTLENEFLKITDRKKEIFKTSSGKYITPLVLENKLKECRFVEQCMIVGEGQKFASALIVPSFDYLKEWAEEKGIPYSTNAEMAQNADMKKEINTFIRDMNKQLASYEHLKRVEIVSQPWSVESGELTPKMSMKRKVILEKNKALIDKIFAVEE